MTETPSSAFRWTAIAAAESARQRAVSCQQRVEALRAGRPFDRADAQRALELLERARTRAAAAEERRRKRVARLVAVKASTSGTAESLEQPPGWVADRLHNHRIAVSALFERYFTLGGEATLFEVDGHVHGVIDLPSNQRSILEHALWELIELTAD